MDSAGGQNRIDACSVHRAAIKDRYRHMAKLESTTYKRPLTIDGLYSGHWRQKIVEWMYAIIHFCDLRHETVAAASHFLDLSVMKGIIQNPIDYQVAAMTAFYLALKIYDSPSTRFVKLDSLVKLGSGTFDAQEVIDMERKLLFTLEWRLNPPTPNCFLYQFLELLPADTQPSTLAKIEQHSLKAIEAIVSTDYFSLVDSSILAHAAVLVSFENLEQSDMNGGALAEYSSHISDLTQVESTSQALARYTILMDCIMRSLPFPWEDERESRNMAREQKVGGASHKRSPESPNHIAIP